MSGSEIAIIFYVYLETDINYRYKKGWNKISSSILNPHWVLDREASIQAKYIYQKDNNGYDRLLCKGEGSFLMCKGSLSRADKLRIAEAKLVTE